ncbi:MAG: histidine phosphatase family protein [Chromatiales bacterium]|jgi:hypothetical protein
MSVSTIRNLALIFLLALAGLAGCSTAIKSPEGTTTTVILVRHAERTTFTKVLTEAGKKRAAALVRTLDGIEIDAIYSPDLVRNIDTVKPLAQQRGLTIILVDSKPDTQEVAKRLLHDHPGSTVLWVGNTTNLPSIYADLGGQGEAPMQYGDLFILNVPDKGFTKVTKKYFGYE